MFWIWLILGIITGTIVGAKGYGIMMSIILGIFGPIGLIVSFILPNTKNQEIDK